MNPEQFQRVQELLIAAAGRSPPDREQFLVRSCGNDKQLRREIESLLPHLVGSAQPEPPPEFQSMLRSAAAALVATAMPAAEMPVCIGRYRILRRIAEGGMGVVYEAEQDNPHRRVAVKVLRHSYGSGELAHRFHREADVLGRLQHPGIAHIYDAGITTITLADGRTAELPFLAMEVVHGSTLLSYAHEQSLNTRERMALVAVIGDALHYAHEQGVIHRDLKPANVVVGPDGQPKILDFGVARFVEAETRSISAQTQYGQLLGTIPYMSPEQVVGDAERVDRRSDIYSLGVILFELLAERLPHDVVNLPVLEAARVIHDDEPSRLGSINATFRGEIETIVAKVMSKEPHDRYSTADEFAADIRRYLEDRPILAQPASTWTQVRKFARRNRTLVGGVLATMLTLLIGAGVSVYFGWSATAERNLARRSERAARENLEAAIIARERAERASYRASIAVAGGALRDEQVTAARAQLEATPPVMRGWEWHHLWSRLDESIERFNLAYPFLAAPRWSKGIAMPEDAGEINGRTFFVSSDATAEAWLTIDSNRFDVTIGDVATGKRETIHLDQHRNLFERESRAHYDLPVFIAVDGRKLAFGVGNIYVVDLTRPHVEPAHLSGSVSAQGHGIALSRDGNLWLRFRGLSVADVVDVGSQAIVSTLDARPRVFTYRAVFSHDTRHIYTPMNEGPVVMWETTTGKPVAETHGLRDPTLSISLSPAKMGFGADGMIATTVRSGTIRLWDAQTLAAIGSLRGNVTYARTKFIPNSTHLLSWGSDRPRLWDVRSVDIDVFRGHHSFVYPVAFSPDGATLISGGWDGYIDGSNSLRVWDVASGESIAEWGAGIVNFIEDAKFTPDGNRLIVVAETFGSFTIRIYDVQSGRLQRVLPGARGELAVGPGPGGKGNRIAMGSAGTVWDLQTGELIHTAQAGDRGADFSPSGQWLAVALPDHAVQIVDAQTFAPLHNLAGHRRLVQRLAFSPDGRLLASASEDATVRIWDVAAGAVRAVLAGHDEGVLGLAWHPDGSRLASGGRDNTIVLWDTATWTDVVRLTGHESYVYSLAFSPDGAALASGSGDGTVRMWHTSPVGGRVKALDARKAAVTRIAPKVVKLFDELRDADAVMASIRADTNLTPQGYQIAHQLILRESLRRLGPADSTP